METLFAHFSWFLTFLALMAGDSVRTRLRRARLPAAARPFITGSFFTLLYAGIVAVTEQYGNNVLPDYLFSCYLCAGLYQLLLKDVLNGLKRKRCNDNEIIKQ